MPNEPVIIPTRSDRVDGNPLHNALLLHLPDDECKALFPRLVFLQLRAYDLLNEAGLRIKYAYFMNSGLASVLNVMEDGRSVEVGLTGREGFVGLPLLADFRSSPSRAIIQVEGSGFRVGADVIVEVLPKCPILEKRLQRYVQIMGLQSAQVSACNRLHRVEQRLARWLLMCQDRIASDVVPLTQEFLANMLGTDRSTVTLAAGILQKAGLITYVRGTVKIMDRSALENVCCECYKDMAQQTSKWEEELAQQISVLPHTTEWPTVQTRR